MSGAPQLEYTLSFNTWNTTIMPSNEPSPVPAFIPPDDDDTQPAPSPKSASIPRIPQLNELTISLPGPTLVPTEIPPDYHLTSTITHGGFPNLIQYLQQHPDVVDSLVDKTNIRYIENDQDTTQRFEIPEYSLDKKPP